MSPVVHCNNIDHAGEYATVVNCNNKDHADENATVIHCEERGGQTYSWHLYKANSPPNCFTESVNTEGVESVDPYTHRNSVKLTLLSVKSYSNINITVRFLLFVFGVLHIY